MTVVLTTGQGKAPQPVEVPRRVGSVKLGELLGEGTGGAVFSGFDEALNRRVAVKLLHRTDSASSQAVSELVHGLRSAGAIKHPNVVTVHAVESVLGFPVIVMEHIDGISMRELLLRTGALDADRAQYLLRHVTRGVEALHLANAVHRDIKPANILCDRGGGLHVCDFGLACNLRSAVGSGGLTPVGGSPLYMAPEMFAGQVSPQSDVYALGVMLFEALCGQPPFNADTLTAMQLVHETTPPPLELLDRRGLAPELLDIVERSLHKQRIMRYKTATHLLRALEVLRSTKRDDLLQSRVAEIVNASPHAGAAPQSPAAEHTTFDLVARRAAEKRGQRAP